MKGREIACPLRQGLNQIGCSILKVLEMSVIKSTFKIEYSKQADGEYFFKRATSLEAFLRAATVAVQAPSAGEY
jgi:hypothetical protein